MNADNDGDPGAALCTLSDPSSFTSGRVSTFDAPPAGANQCPTLTANTTYFVVIDRKVDLTDLKLRTTFSSHEDTGGAAGWSISNNRKYFQSGEWEETASVSYMIKVSGVAVDGPPPELPSDFDTLGAAGATNALGIWSDGTTMVGDAQSRDFHN